MKKIICEKVLQKYVAYFICKNDVRESELNLVEKNFRNLTYYEVSGHYREILQRDYRANPPNYEDTITFVLNSKGNFVYKGKDETICETKTALFYHTKNKTYFRLEL